MPEYGFSLACIFQYKDIIYGSVFIPEYTGQRKPAFWQILRSTLFFDSDSLHFHCSFKYIFWVNINTLNNDSTSKCKHNKNLCNERLNVPALFNPSSANPQKWLNTLKQFVGKSQGIVWVCLIILLVDA